MQALQAYEWMKRHTRHGEGVDLKPYAADVERAVQKTLNRRPKPQTAPDAPAPEGFLAGSL